MQLDAAPRLVTAEALRPEERIISLDILRGIALFGMLIVHFYDHAGEGSGLAGAIATLVETLISSRAFSTFALLFGAGAALQLGRARLRGVKVAPLYLRRMAGLALFGAVAHAVLGFNVLLAYAVWGVLLLPLSRCSGRTLLVIALVTTFSGMTFTTGRSIMMKRSMTPEAIQAHWQAKSAEFEAAWALRDTAQVQTSLVKAIPYRVRHMVWFHQQEFFLYFPGEVPLFLWGMLAVKLGLLQRPGRHLRLIGGIAAVGLAGWAASQWVVPLLFEMDVPWLRRLLVILFVSTGPWLVFSYIGIVLIGLATVPRATQWLAWFSWPGRAALSVYFLQILIIDLLTSSYALGIGKFPSWVILPGATALFGAQLLASRWWFARFRFGPLEWLWRVMTYGGRPPFRRVSRGGPVVPAPIAVPASS